MRKKLLAGLLIGLNILMLAALVGLIVRLVRTPRRDQQITRSYQEIILVAIGKYADRTGAVPTNPQAPEGGATYEDIGVARPDGLTDAQWEVYARSALLFRDLVAEPQCLDIVGRLPRGAVARGEQDHPAAFVDAYGNCMDYRPHSAVDDGPALISGGPDGRIGGEYADDDIRSDRR